MTDVGYRILSTMQIVSRSTMGLVLRLPFLIIGGSKPPPYNMKGHFHRESCCVLSISGGQNIHGGDALDLFQ